MRLPATFPFPSPTDIAETIAQLRAVPPGSVLLADGLAFCALPSDAIATVPHKIIALVHHPLGYEAGLTQTQSEALIASERAALSHAAHIIVTSEPTRDTLVNDFGILQSRITIAEPGTDAALRALPTNAEPVILSVGSIVPRKAFHILVEALAGLQTRAWRLRIVGSPDRAPQTAIALRAQIAAAGFDKRIELAGEMDADALESAYAGADVFVLPSLYEGYGMVLAEAMARGLPIVCTTGGAAAKTVPDDAGLKVPPGNAVALRAALEQLLGDAAMRKNLGDASWRAGQNLPRWRDTAATVAGIIEHVAGTRS